MSAYLAEATITMAAELLFEWGHRRVTCQECGRSILWPMDEQAPPVCETCWDRAIEAEYDRRGEPHRRHPFTPTELALIACEFDRIQSMPRPGRVEEVTALGLRFGVSGRTIYRVAEKAENAFPVQVVDWRALFVRGTATEPPHQATAWELSTV